MIIQKSDGTIYRIFTLIVDGPLTASTCQDGGGQGPPPTGAFHGKHYNNRSRSCKERLPIHLADAAGSVVMQVDCRRVADGRVREHPL